MIEPIYKTIYMDSYEDLGLYLEDYIKRLYKLVWVEVIYGVQYCYIITCRRDREPEVVAIPAGQYESWWAEYGPLPEVGEVMIQTFINAQGYALAIDVVVIGEPDDVAEIEEVMYQ